MSETINATFNGAPNNNNAGCNMYTGQTPQQMAVFKSNLTDEEKELLTNKVEYFNIGLTNIEKARALCNHRKFDGTGDSLVIDPVTGLARCTICGYEFKPIEPDLTPENLMDRINSVIDVIQTCKIMFCDLPNNASREYFQIIGLLEKLPMLFDSAVKNMNKHDAYTWQYNNRNMGTMSMFSNLAATLGGFPGVFNQNAYAQQQPMMNNMACGYPNMAYGQQPMMNNGYGAPNAFGFAGASQMNPYNAQPNNFTFTPNQTPTAVQPTVNPSVPTAPVAADINVTQNPIA